MHFIAIDQIQLRLFPLQVQNAIDHSHFASSVNRCQLKELRRENFEPSLVFIQSVLALLWALR